MIHIRSKQKQRYFCSSKQWRYAVLHKLVDEISSLMKFPSAFLIGNNDLCVW